MLRNVKPQSLMDKVKQTLHFVPPPSFCFLLLQVLPCTWIIKKSKEGHCTLFTSRNLTLSLNKERLTAFYDTRKWKMKGLRQKAENDQQASQ